MADIFHGNAGFFLLFTHKGMLKVLAMLNKPCNKAKHPGRAPWRTGGEDPVIPLHQRNDGR
jgi:hypothetical protein